MQVDIKAPQGIKDKEAVKAQVLLKALRDKTPAEIKTYINNSVTDLPSAKVVLEALAIAVGYLIRGL